MRKNRAQDRKGADKVKNGTRMLLLVFLLGIVCGLIVERYVLGAGQASRSAMEMRPGGYEFINPLLECDMAQDTIEGKDLEALKQKIKAFISEQEKKKEITHVSLYFRDLNNGPWIGVDERVNFSPSSLLKVPLMIAILKEAETHPTILRRKLVYAGPGDSNALENIQPSRSIQRGISYTIDELINYTIVYSDNNAYLLLLKNFPQDKLIKVYTELGVEVPFDSKQEDFMSVREYASFFRILFNASYLNREMSTKALRIMSKVDFKGGLAGGLPPQVGLVHKFGERSLGAKEEIKQLHDCGIVYYPNHPYLLCVMTRGTGFTALNDAIKGISQLVFNELDGQYKKNP